MLFPARATKQVWSGVILLPTALTAIEGQGCLQEHWVVVQSLATHKPAVETVGALGAMAPSQGQPQGGPKESPHAIREPCVIAKGTRSPRVGADGRWISQWVS